ncbi:MAG: SCP2 sterol-binding domain-containing protein [Halieaceae bacterium]|nr:SCP2 sterol-binding domain-containing protein [Halieaceae bacterium]
MTQQHDPAIVTAALAGVEAALARATALAPEAQQALRRMGETLIAIEFTSPAVEVFVHIHNDGHVSLASYNEAKPAVRVRGTLESFLGLATADDPAATLINSDIEVIGNTAPLLELQSIVTKMDVDWEAPLVTALGDVAGHQLAESLRGLFSWGEQAMSRLRRQLSEFILEEGRLSPPAAELEWFYGEVQSLSLRVDRLESRARRLLARIEALSS